MGGKGLKKDAVRAIRRARFFHYLKIITVVAAAVVLSVMIWYFMKPGHSRVRHVESAETVSITPAAPAALAAGDGTGTAGNSGEEGLYAPSKSDGTGEAGVMRIPDDRVASSGLSGWQESDDGRWYEVSRGNCYYGGFKEIGGKTYYFKQDGYSAVGWTPISYQNGAYFDSDGVYIPNRQKELLIALTFDSGPSGSTSDILDVLSDYSVKATFFLQGSQIEANKDIISRIAALGHMIGSMGFTGKDLAEITDDAVRREFEETDQLIAENSSLEQAEAVRFPNGFYTKEKVAVTGRANILWDCDSGDLDTADPNQIAATIYSQLQAGSVIRLHDYSYHVVEALKIILPELISHGYEFVTVRDLAASRGYELYEGATYFGFKKSDLDAKMVNDR